MKTLLIVGAVGIGAWYFYRQKSSDDADKAYCADLYQQYLADPLPRVTSSTYNFGIANCQKSGYWPLEQPATMGWLA